MNAPAATLRPARWAELVFSIVSLYLAASLPLRPVDSRGVWLMVHWYGMTVLAIGLVIALRRPSRVSWAIAAALSAYFTINCAIGVVATRRGEGAAAYAGPALILSYAILGLALVAQLYVGFRCWRARTIWHRPPSGDIIAPVA